MSSTTKFKSAFRKAAFALMLPLLAAVATSAQTTVVDLTAVRTSTTLPDGNTLPMWGYVCGSQAGDTAGACTSLNTETSGWAPVLVTAPTGHPLTINLSNNLPTNTSLIIVGQLAGGLGNPVKTDSPAHPSLTVTWPIASSGSTFTPPTQAQRARSFVPEAGPMNGTQTYTWNSLKPGTYLISTGTRPSIQGPMGLYGVLVVTNAPTGASTSSFVSGCAYPGANNGPCTVPYDADAVMLFSEIDPVQNAAVDSVAASAPAGGLTETIENTKWDPGCGAAHTCYPPAVAYSPMYFLINGRSFDKTSPASSAIQLAQNASTGNVLLRFVNASPRMHVPTVVGQSMSLIAEDGNVLPEVSLAVANSKPLSVRVQNEVFLAAGKVYDTLISPKQTVAGAFDAAALPVFDRELSLGANNRLDSGMMAYVQIGNAAAGTSGGVPAGVAVQAVADTFIVPVGAATFTGNVLSNDVGISNASPAASCAMQSAPQTIATNSGNTVILNPNGSFTLQPTGAAATLTLPDSFQYCGNGNTTFVAGVSFNGAVLGKPPVANNITFSSNVANYFKTGGPGVLAAATDPNNYPLTAQSDPANPLPNWVTLSPNGSFTATPPGGQVVTFNYIAVNSQGAKSSSATVTINFAAGSGINVNLQDAQTQTQLADYKWIIEEDDSYYWPTGVTTPVGTPTLATNFHRSYMPVVASGCTGPISCEAGQTILDVTPGSPTLGQHVDVAPQPTVMPGQVALDPNKHYYISILPGDAADAFNHGGGAAQTVSGNVTKLSEVGTTVTAITGNDPGLTVGQYASVSGATNPGYNGLFFVTADTANGFTYSARTTGMKSESASTAEVINWSGTRVFNPASDCVFATGQPTGNCGHTMGGSPISPGQTSVTVNLEPNPLQPAQLSIIVFEDNSPTNGDIDGAEEQQPGLGGFQIILNDVAGATGITTGQITYDMFNMPLSNALIGTLDSATGLDACPSIPAQLQRNGRVVPGTGVSPKNLLVGMVITCPTFEADGRTVSPLAGHALIKNLFPNRFDVLAKPGADREAAGEAWLQTSTLEGTHANDAFAKVGEPPYFQEFGSPGYHSFIGFINPAHIAAVNARLKGNNSVTGKVTNLRMSRPSQEGLYDSQSHAALAQTVCYVGLNASNGSGDNISFAQCDQDGNFTLTGVPPGQYQLAIWDEWQDQILQYQNVVVPPNASGQTIALGDEPAFSWFQTIITQTYLDNGADNPGISQVGVNIRFRDGQFAAQSGTDGTGNATFNELFPLFNWYVVETDTTRFKGSTVNVINDAGGPADPASTTYGTSYGLSRDWVTGGILNSKETFPLPPSLQVPGARYYPGTTVRNDPGSVVSEGFQAFISQPQILEFGKKPYNPGENGGIYGHVVYNSTRPFDDPQIVNQNLWEPLVPNVTVNLYQEVPAADGTSTTALKLVDSATTTSWDAWVNGKSANGAPNLSCPGQDPADPFFNFTLGTANQYQCYDGFHNWNQMEPAPYDGRYQFPTTACTVCKSPNPDSTTAVPLPNMLPPGKYVTEVVLPAGFEVVKEEDKNILIGDAYIAPVTQQFGGMGNIFILPDQASINEYNVNNPNNPTNDLGRTSFGGFNVGELQQNTPCVGQLRVVPDFMSISPGSGQVAPFAGASKHLCDRREVTLTDQMQGKADFFIFTKTPKAAKFTGIILDDLSSEFNTTKPDYGEKYAVPFLPVSFRDFNGLEVSRTHADQFGLFNGLVYSTWEVNPPNPTGYAPNMMITCMNDPGPILDTRTGSSTYGQMITDPLYNPQYSNFCYTNAYMPGTTDYMDTPVLPVSAFAAGDNPVDCAYPDATPAIKRVDGDGQFGPWVSAAGHNLTIIALGDVSVPNNAYNGPSTSSTGLANVATATRHYGFGSNAGTAKLVNGATGVVVANLVTSGSGLGWTDGQIVAQVPANVPAGAYELLIIGANGRKSVDAVTITVGGTVAAYVTPPTQNVTPTGLVHPIQDAIDAANPGDLIMLQAGNYPELVIMWKPVRLQGVGAASVIINAAKYPTQKLAQWRPRVNCFFGVDSQGNPLTNSTASCPANQLNTADPLTGQEITGGIVLLEPSVLGTEEGAGITVIAKNLPSQSCGGNVPGSQSNFLCAASRIDGVSITGGDSGGGIYVNGWAHNLEIANNRIYGNAGVYHGGIRIGQPYLEGLTGLGPFGFDNNVKVHNNSITQNGTAESNTGEAGAGGGLSLCTGTDNYQVTFNFVCGNFTVGDGGGIGHIGLSWNGNIANNWVLFNQSFIQSQATNGGGIAIEGEPAIGGVQTLGAGNVIVDSNLILGNSAQGGHGGGIRLQDVNGADVIANPTTPRNWWAVALTNNMIVDNVAGWAGGGVSLMDTVNSQIINNTVVNNDSTATAGPVIAVSPTGTQSTNQPAGISAEPHGAVFATAFGRNTNCGGNTNCNVFSNPYLENNIVYKNRSFYFQVTSGPGSGANPGSPATTTLVPTLIQTSIGACPSGATYWDLGVLGQSRTTPVLHMNPSYSVLTPDLSNAPYNNSHNQETDPLLAHAYCNGSRANPGIPDSTPPNPPFTFQAGGAEDEGGNWVDLRYGPLSLSDSSIAAGNPGYGVTIGDYRICGGSAVPAATCGSKSPAVDTGSTIAAPNHDIFGATRPQGAGFDIGAYEVTGIGAPIGSITGGPLTFDNVVVGSTSGVQTLTLHNTGNADLTGINVAVSAQFIRSGGTCGATLTAAAGTCTITVAFQPTGSPGTVGGTVTVTANVAVSGSPVTLTGHSVAAVTSATLTPTPFNFGTVKRGTTPFGAQQFTLTNTGNVTLTGIASPFISTDPTDFVVASGLFSVFNTCGTSNPVPVFRITTLAPGATCVVYVQFRPPTADTTGVKNGALSAPAGAAGTPKAVLSGTAN